MGSKLTKHQMERIILNITMTTNTTMDGS